MSQGLCGSVGSHRDVKVVIDTLGSWACERWSCHLLCFSYVFTFSGPVVDKRGVSGTVWSRPYSECLPCLADDVNFLGKYRVGREHSGS